MALTKIPDGVMLVDYITKHLKTPFAWGTHDCICFVVGWIELRTGVEHLQRYRPWSTEREAWHIVRRLGGLDVEFDKYLLRVPANLACDGDVTIVDKCAYIFSGRHIVSVATDGLIFKDRMVAKCAWSF
jgi:hypothetical protein